MKRISHRLTVNERTVEVTDIETLWRIGKEILKGSRVYGAHRSYLAFCRNLALRVSKSELKWLRNVPRPFLGFVTRLPERTRKHIYNLLDRPWTVENFLMSRIPTLSHLSFHDNIRSMVVLLEALVDCLQQGLPYDYVSPSLYQDLMRLKELCNELCAKIGNIDANTLGTDKVVAKWYNRYRKKVPGEGSRQEGRRKAISGDQQKA